MIERRKVYSFITRGRRLLVFVHVDIQGAGIQVPGGSVEPGEAFDAAVLREAEEETGLAGLRLVRLLAEQRIDLNRFGVDEIHDRRFYHLICEQDTPETWLDAEETPSTGEPGPIWFRLYWVDLPEGLPTFPRGAPPLSEALLASVEEEERR